MPSMIEEQSKSNPPSITWRVFILQNEEYAKGAPIVISSDYDFQKWMDCIVESKAKRGGMILMMENPLVKEKIAHMEALLAKSICPESSRLASQLGPAASNDENSSCQDYKDLDVYLNDIYKTYSINMEFDCKIPCYPHPTDKQKYILLTPDTMRKTPGSLNTSVLVAIATTVAQAQAVVNSTNLRAKAPAEASTNSPTSSKPDPGAIGTISGYLDFSGVFKNKDHILHMLSSNDINQFSLFKPDHFSNEELFAIGLKIGTIAKLQANVNKYQRHLAGL
ncbi:hypothetical protein PCASD_14507 [Puccinia coronata f. sp. avenae]|uniref:Uncharacterized protein n=1 Tax=Puccinia coronata f. sp. avenae TaxID=200324 RepID=A0A2N5TEV6_9BASI|nr:hypothetical protein PCASD_14507 [Puccinia coronata f. sp. avenae]